VGGGWKSSWKGQCSFNTSVITRKKYHAGIRMVQKELLVEESTGVGVVKVKAVDLIEESQQPFADSFTSFCA